MPRLFIGLEIPDDVRQTLSLLRGGLPGARWIDPENYHLTLRFIGDIESGLAHEIVSMLGRVNRRPFEVQARRPLIIRRPQATRDRGVGGVVDESAGIAGRARAADAERRAGAGRTQIHPARHARAPAQFIQPSGSRLSFDARIARLGRIPRRTVRPLLLARLGRRRTLCHRGCVRPRRAVTGGHALTPDRPLVPVREARTTASGQAGHDLDGIGKEIPASRRFEQSCVCLEHHGCDALSIGQRFAHHRERVGRRRCDFADTLPKSKRRSASNLRASCCMRRLSARQFICKNLMPLFRAASNVRDKSSEPTP